MSSKESEVIRKDGTRVRIQQWSDNIVRVSCTQGEYTEDDQMILSCSWSEVCRMESSGHTAVSVRFDAERQKLIFYKENGELLLEETDGGLCMKKEEIFRREFVHRGKSVGTMFLKSVSKRDGYTVSYRFASSDDEVIYGLGSGETGCLDRKEQKHYIYQQNYKAPVPFFVSTKGYGILFPAAAYSVFEGTDEEITFTSKYVGMADYFVIIGANTDEVIRGYRFLTGKAVMMPKWFFGYAQSKEHYHTQKELLDTLAEYRRRKVPLDLIVQDWHYWEDSVWSDKSFDSQRYPDPEAMCRTVHDAHAKIMISVWPNTKGGENQKDLWYNDALLGDGQVYDVFKKEARDLYWEELNQIFKNGIDAWWCDCSEPYEWGWDYFNEKEDAIEIALTPFYLYMESDKVNAFSLLHSRNIYEHQRAQAPEKRVVNLTRSGYAGQQRYGTVVWSGDIIATWEMMRAQIAEALNFCISGLPYWTLDIGGFFVWKGQDPCNAKGIFSPDYYEGYKELYTRWLQFGAFLPMFRSHGTNLPREIWNFGEEGEVYYETIKKFIELRYKLLPYIYSVAYQVYQNDSTIMRMLFFDFQEDEKVKYIDDQFMFGPSLMVCPLLPRWNAEAGEEVYLPEARWYDFWTGKRMEGGRTIEAETPIDRIPIYVPVGSILVMGPVMQYTDELPQAPYNIRIYSGKNAEFVIYEDSGNGYGYEKGECAVYQISWQEQGKTAVIAKRSGSYPGMIRERELIVTVIDGESERTEKIRYRGEEVRICFL